MWKNLDRFHHDFAIGGDGRIYGLTHQYRSDFTRTLDHLSDLALDDHLTIVSPQGRTLRKITLLDALARSPFRELLHLTPAHALEDPLHTNAVDLLSKKDAQRLASKLPVVEEGQILLSFRELAGGVIALLDPEEKEIVWAQRGQHDPDILPNGTSFFLINSEMTRAKDGPESSRSTRRLGVSCGATTGRRAARSVAPSGQRNSCSPTAIF